MKKRGQYQIQLYNRQTKATDIEQVYGRCYMDFFYGTSWGRKVEGLLLCRHPVSKLYGWLQNHSLSRRKIASFIKQYDLQMDEYCVPSQGFTSFNAFFTRQLKPGVRAVSMDPHRVIAPADSRLQVFPVHNALPLEIKGMHITLPQLLGMNRMDASFQGGVCLCFRLAPCDYHRFSYMEDGIQGIIHSIQGPLHSVSPLALRHKKTILGNNFRQWCHIQTARLGTMIQVEIGAMMVGSIVQHQPGGGPCRRGEEKGYFQFGGSTVIIVLAPGQIALDDDILLYSKKGIETLVRFGESIGRIASAEDSL